jgi:hypothetical protein
MITKTCKTCERALDLDRFYRNELMRDGRFSSCIECVREEHRRYRAENKSKTRAYTKSISERRKEYMRAYRATEAGMEAMRRGIRAYAARNRFKNNARRVTQRAIAAGTLTPLPCEVCGISAVEAHHDDYSKPLSVRWLCRQHHLAHHSLERDRLLNERIAHAF